MLSDYEVLLHYLKSSFSTHQLDALMKYDKLKTKGWKSHAILKKYFLEKDDKGKLFLYTSEQCKKILKELLAKPETGKLDKILSEINPKSIEKYKNTYVSALGAEEFYSIFEGEARNIIQSFFMSRKKLIGICQLKNCNSEKLETAHLRAERKEIFLESALSSVIESESGLKKFDVYKTMKTYLEKHQYKDSVRFLCNAHHTELDNLKRRRNNKTLNSFKKLITNDMDEIGKKKQSISLIPAFPIGLHSKEVTDTSILIEWKKEPTLENNKSGQILWRKEPATYELMMDGVVVYNGEYSKKGIKITELKAGQNYEFTLIASNKFGKSPVSYLKVKTKI